MENNRFFGSISASSIKNFFPKSVSTKQKMMKSVLRKPKANNENIRPIDSNIQISDPPLLPSSSFQKKSASKAIVVHEKVTRSEAQLDVSATPSDSAVKVVVRINPSSGRGSRDWTLKKVSNDSIIVGGRKFMFDSVFDVNSIQDDIFQLVGVPLVNDALAGYNTSILAYGQTGSGKTYTMWGPPSAMVECPSTDGLQGIVPRIFEMLFSEIQKDQENSDGRQINYQCRCSFLEIYNEQIGDLLDPTQRNLEIKDDTKNGLYVENLTEEYVTSYEDVTHILIKGLSNRKVGATSINSKSSRSHIVFTCNIETWCKETSSKCFGSSKTSRISLIDLAGFERNFPEDAGIQCLKEAKFVKKSTSHLGNLVNALVKRSQSGITEDIPIPYGSSCLTQFLRESLGGNAKVSVICAISTDDKFSGETASTLRFGQRVKFVQNEPVINEITEDDVNDLSDQIRLLKEELIRAKSNVSESVGNHGYFKGRSGRESLNQLRLSLNRSLILPHTDTECEEVCANENDVKELQAQIDSLRDAHEEDIKDTEDGCETDLASEQYVSCSEESENEEISPEGTHSELCHPNEVSVINYLPDIDKDSAENYCAVQNSILVTARRQSEVLQEPTFSESPKIKNLPRKSIVLSANSLANKEDAKDICKKSESVRHSGNQIQSSLRSSRIFPGPTESLAASLHKGLEIIDYHQRNSALNRSSVSFSFEHLALQACPEVDKANASAQTLPRAHEYSDAPPVAFLCRNCQQKGIIVSTGIEDSLKTWMVPIDEAKRSNRLDAQNDLVQAIEKQKELENICKEQAQKIEELNQLLIKYKLEEEKNSQLDYNNSPNRIERNAVLLPNDDGGNKLLMWNNAENHDSELIKEKCEIKEIQEEFYNSQKNQTFDTNEKEALLKEIECLRSKLCLDSDATPNKSTEKIRSSLLAQSMQLRKSGAFFRAKNEEDIEKERERWTEMESEWICLTDELRIDLESYRQRAEKVELELRLEKKCTEELDDALSRSVLGHGRMVEHYAELQEKYNELVERYRLVMQGVADVKKAAAKAGAKGHGSRFAKCLAAELSSLRVERDRERELLRKENKSLKVQLKDTAEAVHAAGELLVRLREAEESASVSEENYTNAKEENDKLKKQIEKLKRKHKMEMITMKQYLAESRLPESALGPFYKEDSGIGQDDTTLTEDDDQAWRAEFGPIYQEHY